MVCCHTFLSPLQLGIPQPSPGAASPGSLSWLSCGSFSLGLLTATVASRIHRAAQPALLYLVPFTLLPLLTMAYLKVRTQPASLDHPGWVWPEPLILTVVFVCKPGVPGPYDS